MPDRLPNVEWGPGDMAEEVDCTWLLWARVGELPCKLIADGQFSQNSGLPVCLVKIAA